MLNALLLAGCLAICPAVLAAQNPAPATLSGTINAKPIPNRVFNPPRDRAVDSFILKHNRAPVSPSDDAEVASILQANICSRLSGAITQAARDAVAQQLGITVTPPTLMLLEPSYCTIPTPRPPRFASAAQAFSPQSLRCWINTRAPIRPTHDSSHPLRCHGIYGPRTCMM